MLNKNFVIVFTIIAFVVGVAFYVAYPTPDEYKAPEDEMVFCTMEAKLCPDGSYVGREGPNCEFAPCP